MQGRISELRTTPCAPQRTAFSCAVMCCVPALLSSHAAYACTDSARPCAARNVMPRFYTCIWHVLPPQACEHPGHPSSILAHRGFGFEIRPVLDELRHLGGLASLARVVKGGRIRHGPMSEVLNRPNGQWAGCAKQRISRIWGRVNALNCVIYRVEPSWRCWCGRESAGVSVRARARRQWLLATMARTAPAPSKVPPSDCEGGGSRHWRERAQDRGQREKVTCSSASVSSSPCEELSPPTSTHRMAGPAASAAVPAAATAAADPARSSPPPPSAFASPPPPLPELPPPARHARRNAAPSHASATANSTVGCRARAARGGIEGREGDVPGELRGRSTGDRAHRASQSSRSRRRPRHGRRGWRRLRAAGQSRCRGGSLSARSVEERRGWRQPNSSSRAGDEWRVSEGGHGGGGGARGARRARGRGLRARARALAATRRAPISSTVAPGICSTRRSAAVR